MFQQDTLAQALKAAGQQLTPAQLEQMYEQAGQEWEDYLDQYEQRLTKNYQQQTGRRVVEAMDKMTMLSMCRQLADEAIYVDYIQPLTDQISEAMPDWDEDEISPQDVLESPTLWKTHWDLIPLNPQMSKLIYELWPDKPSPWTTVANIYLTVLEYQGKDYPDQAGSSLIPVIEQEVAAAVQAMNDAQ